MQAVPSGYFDTKTVVFCVVKFCNEEDTHQRFGVLCLYHLQVIRPDGVIVVITVRISNVFFPTSLYAVMACSFGSRLNLTVISPINSTNF